MNTSCRIKDFYKATQNNGANYKPIFQKRSVGLDALAPHPMTATKQHLYVQSI